VTNDKRPRLDAIIRAITEGKYDEELVEIAEAIASRTEQRKQKVLEMVYEVFGNDHKVTSDKPITKKAAAHLEIIKSKNPKWGPAVDAMVEGKPDDVIAAEKPPQEGMTGEFESRSPTFGSIDPNKEVKDEL